MKPEQRFLKQPKSFWANIRSLSQQIGYTDKKTSQIKIPTLEKLDQAFLRVGLTSKHVILSGNRCTKLGSLLMDYFEYRATILNDYVRPRLMNAEKAGLVFEQLRATLSPTCAIPMNKQKGNKKAPAFFTGIINMLIESNTAGKPCDYDPHTLTTITRKGMPVRTLARRVDGAFPSTVNPIAIWEIKEYYYTTTFGSRVADGIYETLLDGMEIEELRQSEGIDIKHYLMVDDYFTWWELGKSYLCRIVDMLHMGFIDEALFGHEVIERLPTIAKEWTNAQ
jgi:hypothetical protein